MPLNVEELVKAAELLAEQKNMRVTVKFSLASGIATGATTVAGGILLGPVGLLIGGAVGGVTSFIATKGKFKSVVAIIREDLSPEQREALGKHLKEALNDIGITDVLNICTIVLQPGVIQSAFLSSLHLFFKKYLKTSIKK